MSDETVFQQFRKARDAFENYGGLRPNRCTLSLDMGRRAAAEHKAARMMEPMFQMWDPKILFAVDMAAPPETLYLTHVEVIPADP